MGALKQAFLAHELEEEVDVYEPEESGPKAQEREGGGGKTEEGGRGDGGGGGKGGQGGEGKALAEFVSVDMKEEIKVRKQVCNLACMHIHTHIRMNERQVWWNRFKGLWNRTNLSNFNN